MYHERKGQLNNKQIKGKSNMIIKYMNKKTANIEINI